MATQMFLKKLLSDFSSLSTREINQQEADALLSAYNAAFQGTRDSDLIEAANLYKTEGKYFPPRPSELRPFLPVAQPEQTGDYRIRVSVQCGTCKKITTCIQEPALGGPLLCRECYSGMTKEQYETNMKALGRANPKRGVFVKYNSITKTVEISHEQVKYDPAVDVFGEE